MIIRQKIPLITMCCWAVFMMSAPTNAVAQAPPSNSFQELRSRLKLTEGESVQITDDSGKRFKAKLARISDRSISVIVSGVQRELPESSVWEIRHRQRDVWWNGMLIGLGAGAAIGAATVVASCGGDTECQFYALAVGVPLFAGIGAGAGAGIDFAIRKHETVYARPNAAGQRGFRVSPILSKDAKGASLSFTF